MNWPVPTLADVFKARRAISPYLPRTPVLEPIGLAAAMGCRAVLKCENLNPTGAFKVRGGVNLLASLEPEARRGAWWPPRRATMASRSPMPRGSSARKATIFMPEAANPLKAAATVAMGAEVIQTGRDFDAARLAAEEHAARHDLRYIHSSNEPMLVAGVGTATLELLEAVPDLDVIFVPVGGGSGVLGAGVVARASTRRSGSSACRPKARRPSIARGARDAASSPRA